MSAPAEIFLYPSKRPLHEASDEIEKRVVECRPIFRSPQDRPRFVCGQPIVHEPDCQRQQNLGALVGWKRGERLGFREPGEHRTNGLEAPFFEQMPAQGYEEVPARRERLRFNSQDIDRHADFVQGGPATV